jgi:hypothetical protein
VSVVMNLVFIHVDLEVTSMYINEARISHLCSNGHFW